MPNVVYANGRLAYQNLYLNSRQRIANSQVPCGDRWEYPARERTARVDRMLRRVASRCTNGQHGRIGTEMEGCWHALEDDAAKCAGRRNVPNRPVCPEQRQAHSRAGLLLAIRFPTKTRNEVVAMVRAKIRLRHFAYSMEQKVPFKYILSSRG